jgi:hypothetical protein
MYKAQKEAPQLISAGDNAGFLRSAIEGFNLTNPPKKEWKRFKDNELLFTRRFLPYVNEN